MTHSRFFYHLYCIHMACLGSVFATIRITGNPLHGFILLLNFGTQLVIACCLLISINKRHPLFSGRPALEFPRSSAGKLELTDHKTLKTRHDGTDY